jgi:uncharacterized glyoxalase superfamily protein PhnB
MKMPEQYLPVMPYLIVKDAKKFMDFVKEVFNATEQLVMPADSDKIMHGELKIYDAVIMFADASDSWKEKTAAMYIHVDNVNDTYHLALKKGAKILQPPEKKEYGYTAGFEDPFTNQWLLYLKNRP